MLTCHKKAVIHWHVIDTYRTNRPTVGIVSRGQKQVDCALQLSASKFKTKSGVLHL